MSGFEDGLRRIEALRIAARKTADERADEMRPIWQRAIAADAQLARLCDNPAWREEVETRLRGWRHSVENGGWSKEWSRAEVIMLADRIRAVEGDLADLVNEVRALGAVTVDGDLDVPVGQMFAGLLDAFEALDPAVAAAQYMSAIPEKHGGRGDYTQNFRPKPAEEFGRRLAAIFRDAGIPLGGNSSRDKAFAAFLEVAGEYATGAPIPGFNALLADLRKL